MTARRGRCKPEPKLSTIQRYGPRKKTCGRRARRAAARAIANSKCAVIYESRRELCVIEFCKAKPDHLGSNDYPSYQAMETPLAICARDAEAVIYHAPKDWTLAQRVMMDPRNEDTADGILHRIGIADTMALGATCTRARTAWLYYKGKVFNLNKFLTHYVPDAPAFRQMMEDTSSVVTGRCVAEMLRRNDPSKHPLVVVTGPVQGSVVRLHLEDVQGYRAFGEDGYWAETRVITEYARVRGIRPSKVNLRSAFLSRKATMRQEFPIKQMLTLSKISGSGHISYVILQVPKTCVSKTFMSAGTSEFRALDSIRLLTSDISAACANVMTHNRIVAFYPRVTFLHMRSFRIHHPRSAHKWRLVIPLDLAFYERAACLLLEEDYGLLRVHKGKNAIRVVGDSDCWTLTFDEEGNIAGPSSAAFTKKKDDLEGNSWFLRVVDGRISQGVEAARLSDFDPNL